MSENDTSIAGRWSWGR